MLICTGLVILLTISNLLVSGKSSIKTNIYLSIKSEWWKCKTERRLGSGRSAEPDGLLVYYIVERSYSRIIGPITWGTRACNGGPITAQRNREHHGPATTLALDSDIAETLSPIKAPMYLIIMKWYYLIN